MSLVLYAIAPADPPPPDGLRGCEGERLRTLTVRALSAVVSEPERVPGVDEPTLRRYERTVERLADGGPVLPARFGTGLADDAAVRQMLHDRQRELHDALERVRDATELGVRVAWSDASEAPPPGPSAGSAYMHGLLARRRLAQEIAARTDALLGGMARERRLRVLPRPDTPLAAAYLVDRDRVGAFTRAADDLERQLREIGDVRVVCTGPWSPYSFVVGETIAAGAEP
ncbi:MAG: GvpL/GvpF family gas vesicle protein [Solirubrobacteraceae bacterium]